jgi:hypothetical protein
MPDPSSEDPSIRVPASPPAPKRRWRLLRITLWSFGSLIVLLVAAMVAGVLYLNQAAQSALPVLDGDQHLAGLSAPVTVRRDAHGVPHIDAATQEDLFEAQGYVTAQDRLWQMDAFRRNANGDLAEILGPSLVKHDLRAAGSLQFATPPAASTPTFPPDDREPPRRLRPRRERFTSHPTSPDMRSRRSSSCCTIVPSPGAARTPSPSAS